MMKKSFYGLVVCLSMFAVVLWSGVASAGIGDSCAVSADCDDTLYCNGIESCSSEGSICVAGAEPCAIDKFCNEVTSTCDECQIDATCSDSLFCTGVETCVAGACVPGPGNPCEAGKICNDETNVCDVAPACTVDANCNDNLFCTGVETCVAGACVAGPGSPCAAGEICNDVTNVCDVAPACTVDTVDADCNDNLFCTGVETCVDGACVPGPGNPCTGATPVCVEEGTGTCEAALACTDNAICDDMFFCTGVETCVAGACVVGPGNPCSGETPVCNEEANTCEAALACTDNAICDDMFFCTGLETCVAGACVAGPGDPCAAGETCNEDTNTCEIAEGPNLKINKATVKAGKTANKDSIQLSGSLNASQDDLNAAVGGTVIISLMAPGAVVIEYTFPIEAENVNKGKYKSPKPAVKADPVTSLAIDTNKGTIKFSAKNADLTGLSCPITVRVEIGAYNAEQELDEDIVNGPKKPCPPELLE